MPQRGLTARTQRDQVDPDPVQPAGVAKPTFDAVSHPRSKRLGIAGAANFRNALGIERGRLELSHNEGKLLALRRRYNTRRSAQSIFRL